MHPIIALILGLACAGFGGERFVKGAVGIAHWARIPAGIIGSTIAAFATSSPELAVSVNAALAGTPQIALGDALGSNVVNVGLILGIALTLGSMQPGRGALRRDLPVAVAAPFMTALFLMDGMLSRVEGFALFVLFAGWAWSTASAARKSRDATEEVLGEHDRGKSLWEAVIGLALLIVAGNLIVKGAEFVGKEMGWSPFVVGATLVAIGTSMPELATTIISRIKKHDEVGLGTVIGSNIFNGLFIVSIASMIAPIQVEPADVWVGLGAGIATIIAMLPGRSGVLHRWRGWLLLALYVGYVVILLGRGGA